MPRVSLVAKTGIISANKAHAVSGKASAIAGLAGVQIAFLAEHSFSSKQRYEKSQW
jgi:hypothetical protein